MKRPCNYPGCRALLDKSGYCAAHKASAPRRHKLYDAKVRRNDQALDQAARIRSSKRWKDVRRIKLGRNPLCEDPFVDHGRMNTTATATQVHHIKPLATHPTLAFDLDNLMSTCTRCHARLEREVRQSGTETSKTSQDAPQATPDASDGPFCYFG